MAVITTQCRVVWVGPVMGSQLKPPVPTSDPVIMIQLTAVGGSFTKIEFYVPEVAKNQMLAVALAAVSTQSNVDVAVDEPPAPGATAGYLQIYRLWVSGS